MNNWNGIGRLTKDPEKRMTGAGKTVATFTLAINRAYNRDKADFIQCQAWEKTADIILQYVKKGDQLGVQGELNIDQHEGKYYTKINVQSVTLIGGRKTDDTQIEDYIDDSDLPF